MLQPACVWPAAANILNEQTQPLISHLVQRTNESLQVRSQEKLKTIWIEPEVKTFGEVSTTRHLGSQDVSSGLTYPFPGLWHCVYRDRLPGNVRVEHLLSLWGIQACQIGLRTHQRPIVICAADEDLPGQGQRTVSNATVSGAAGMQDNARAEEHRHVPCSCLWTTGTEVTGPAGVNLDETLRMDVKDASLCNATAVCSG